ncbi:MAG: NAD(P)/FAD-dependent oxidoreductase [Caldilineaceae bacterium]|nr:NAD(P)/FAD-dependent oxidoreductase [Caldilineaceae bacterium]
MDPHVVIVGGGFGGLYAAKALLKHKPGEPTIRVTLIDRRNHHLFQPLLYQVATAGLSPGNIAAPLRGILRGQKNVQVLMAEVVNLDAPGNAVILADGSRIGYDYLIIATGASHSYFGNDQWAADAPGLKTLEDALEIRRRVLLAYEQAERTEDPAEREALLTFVVIGGGPTGLELAGALGEMAHLTLRENFRRIDPAEAKIILIEGVDRLLPPYPPDLSAKAEEMVTRLGVTVLTKTRVTGVTDRYVTVSTGESTREIPCRTVLWAAGVQASPLGKVVQSQTGAELDRVGRVIVEPDLSVVGFPNLFVIGDLAQFAHGVERPLPGVAPVAMQQGKYVAEVIRERLAGTSPEMFRYHDKGSMATIGRAAAVAQIGRWKLSGYLAWLSWLFIHLLYLAGFDNRMLVFLQWLWNYFTYTRGVRLIVNRGINEPREKGK